MLLRIATHMGAARKDILRLRHSLTHVRSIERAGEFATLQLKSENLCDDIEAIFETMRIAQQDATVMAIAIKRHIAPPTDAKDPKLLYSEGTPMQREMMREGTLLPDSKTRPYRVEQSIDPTPRILTDQIPR